MTCSRSTVAGFFTWAVLVLLVAIASIVPSRKTPRRELSFSEFRQAKIWEQPSRDARGHRWRIDLDTDGQLESVQQQSGRLSVDVDARTRWQTPANWWVDDVLIADLVGEGRPQLILSVWKAGSYGDDRPSWVLVNDELVRQHLFVFSLEDGQLRHRWQSSALPRPNCSLVKSRANGRTVLRVTEGDYRDLIHCRPRADATWAWNGFGFTNLIRHVTP